MLVSNRGRTVRRPQIEQYVKQSWATSGDLDIAATREMISARARARPRGPEMNEVRELPIKDLPARLYRPVDASGPVHNFLLIDEISPAAGGAIDRLAADLRDHLSS